MLKLEHVEKKFNNINVLKDVNFKAYPGEILGYLGPNGAGKSTTIKILAGLLEPTSGSVFLNDKLVKTNTVEYKKKIGYLPEHSELYEHLTGLEYLQLIGRLRQIPEDKIDPLINGLLDHFGLFVDMHLPISSYSKGMKQKTLICSAIMHNPDILLLDEPLSGLDVATTLIVKDLLGKLSKMGKIIIYSSHILEVVEKISDRVIVINKGKIVADDTIGNLRERLSHSSLESIFKELVGQEHNENLADSIISYLK